MRWATRIRWQWKVFIPIVAILVLGISAILLTLTSRQLQEFQWIVIGIFACAILLCVVLLGVLLVLIERPLEELMVTIKRVRGGDLTAHVGFSNRDDDVGRLGKQFNEMVEQLDQNRVEIEELHKGEMARAQHLATLGELAAGLAHEIRNRRRRRHYEPRITSQQFQPRRHRRRSQRSFAHSSHLERSARLFAAAPPRFSPRQPQHHRRTSRRARAPAGPDQTHTGTFRAQRFTSSGRPRSRAHPTGRAQHYSEWHPGNFRRRPSHLGGLAES